MLEVQHPEDSGRPGPRRQEGREPGGASAAGFHVREVRVQQPRDEIRMARPAGETRRSPSFASTKLPDDPGRADGRCAPDEAVPRPTFLPEPLQRQTRPSAAGVPQAAERGGPEVFGPCARRRFGVCARRAGAQRAARYAEFLRHNQQLCKRCKHPRLLPGQTEAAAPTGAARPAATGPAPKRQRLGEAAPAAAASPPPRPPSSPSPPPARDCDPDAAWAQERERRKKKEQEAEERRRLMRERRQKAGAAGCAPQDLEADAEKRRLIRERRRGMGLAAKEVIIADD
ncbi:unnamed protein product [Prorocentrum cordatum]|uniref:Uncharacterized protein n=1 Tax=Prorocentrum cordatum TaxID=2364126 RepID=A0ABN9W558_9DINO|nr:unnamed protein product [Polarella glacialis]